MNDATGLAEALLGLDGFRILEVAETPAEVVVRVETTVDLAGLQRPLRECPGRCGRGFTSFEHYRLRLLSHAGSVMWPQRPSPPRIRTRSARSDA
jgi:hypothetical protein